jgi:hypothetical protein
MDCVDIQNMFQQGHQTISLSFLLTTGNSSFSCVMEAATNSKQSSCLHYADPTSNTYMTSYPPDTKKPNSIANGNS